LTIKIGTVFRWNNFPDARYGEKNKARWFMCVGFSGAFVQISVAYLCTTTTQLEKFKGTGSRRNHDHFIFKTNQFPTFDEDCAIDFDEKPYLIELRKLNAHLKDIEEKGVLDENTLRMIYKRFLRSKHISFKELSDIHNSLNVAGITGLKKPKRFKK